MRRLLSAAVAAAILAAGSPAGAGDTACPQHYPGGNAPEIGGPEMQSQAREVCYRAFAVVHSGVTKTPLWAAEHVTPDGLAAASALERINAFHPEAALPPAERAELADYSRSGYDRGHMAPSADMPDPEAQQESFTLANMVPQDPKLNRGTWEGIESAVRAKVRAEGDLYVITGPLFAGTELNQLNGRLFVPSHVFKVVYDPRSGKAAAYLAENAPVKDYRTVTVAELERLSGVNLLPNMPPKTKEEALELPPPNHRGGKSGPKAKRRGSGAGSLLRSLGRMFR